MTALTHHSIHIPEPMVPAVHWMEKFLGAVFFTVLAPLAFAIFILSGLLVAMGVSSVF